MSGFEIAIESRTDTGKGVARKLRAKGRIPAVIYGAGIEKNRSITLGSRDIVAVINRPDGLNSILTLKEGDNVVRAFVKEYQVHPISRSIMHCDFMAVADDQPFLVDIPVRTTGKSKGEEAGARRFLAKREITVRTVPANLPSEIVVDISHMDTSEVMYVDEITFPEGVTPVYLTRYPVIVIQKARAEVEETTTVAEGEEVAEGAEGEEATETPAE